MPAPLARSHDDIFTHIIHSTHFCERQLFLSQSPPSSLIPRKGVSYPTLDPVEAGEHPDARCRGNLMEINQWTSGNACTCPFCNLIQIWSTQDPGSLPLYLACQLLGQAGQEGGSASPPPDTHLSLHIFLIPPPTGGQWVIPLLLSIPQVGTSPFPEKLPTHTHTHTDYV